MGKVKALVEEVREEIIDLLEDNPDISVEEVKQTLKNKYFFSDKTNIGLTNESLIEELYNFEVRMYG
jgi:predicted Zn-dependent peptidase